MNLEDLLNNELQNELKKLENSIGFSKEDNNFSLEKFKSNLIRYQEEIKQLETEYNSQSEILIKNNSPEEIEKREKEKLYNDALRLIREGKNYDAFTLLRKLSGYKDSTDLLNRVKSELEKAYALAHAHIKNGDYEKAILIYKDLSKYRDSEKLLKEAETFFTEKFPEYENKYNKAIELIKNNKISLAVPLLITIKGFKDSNELLIRCNEIIDTKLSYAQRLYNSKKYTEAMNVLEPVKDDSRCNALYTECAKKSTNILISTTPITNSVKNAKTSPATPTPAAPKATTTTPRAPSTPPTPPPGPRTTRVATPRIVRSKPRIKLIVFSILFIIIAFAASALFGVQLFRNIEQLKYVKLFIVYVIFWGAFSFIVLLFSIGILGNLFTKSEGGAFIGSSILMVISLSLSIFYGIKAHNKISENYDLNNLIQFEILDKENNGYHATNVYFNITNNSLYDFYELRFQIEVTYPNKNTDKFNMECREHIGTGETRSNISLTFYSDNDYFQDTDLVFMKMEGIITNIHSLEPESANMLIGKTIEFTGPSTSISEDMIISEPQDIANHFAGNTVCIPDDYCLALVDQSYYKTYYSETYHRSFTTLSFNFAISESQKDTYNESFKTKLLNDDYIAKSPYEYKKDNVIIAIGDIEEKTIYDYQKFKSRIYYYYMPYHVFVL